MGLTYIGATLTNIAGAKKSIDVRFLVDSGAVYSVLPQKVWKALGLKPAREVEFTLADGTSIIRSVSECRFEIEGMEGISPVILGLPEDMPLLGIVTLEVLGLMLNPLNRKLLPMKMIMA